MVNVFALDLDPRKAAAMHCDQHVGKLLIEGVQVLSQVHWNFGSRQRHWGYDHNERMVNMNLTVWASTHVYRFGWLRRLLQGLAFEHKYRFGTEHAAETELELIATPPLAIPTWDDRGPETGRDVAPFVLRMPDRFKQDDGVAAYREYYCHKIFRKGVRPKWTRTRVPTWYEAK